MDKAAMGKSARRKGHKFERWLARWFSDAGFIARRIPQYQAVKWNGADIEAKGLPYHIEAKRKEKLSIEKAFAQASEDAPDHLTPIVIHKKNNAPVFVTMSLEHFTEMVKQIHGKS